MARDTMNPNSLEEPLDHHKHLEMTDPLKTGRHVATPLTGSVGTSSQTCSPSISADLRGLRGWGSVPLSVDSAEYPHCVCLCSCRVFILALSFQVVLCKNMPASPKRLQDPDLRTSQSLVPSCPYFFRMKAGPPLCPWPWASPLVLISERSLLVQHCPQLAHWPSSTSIPCMGSGFQGTV